MVVAKDGAALHIDLTLDFGADVLCRILGKGLFEDVQHNFAYFLNVIDIEPLAINDEPTLVEILTTAEGVERALVEDHNVVLVFLLHVCEDRENSCLEFVELVVTVVEIFCFGQMQGGVEDWLWSLRVPLDHFGDLEIDVSWDRLATNRRNGVGWDTMGRHGKDPVFCRKLPTLLLDHFLQLLLLFIVGLCPALVLQADDFIKALILTKGAKEQSQVLLVHLEELQ